MKPQRGPTPLVAELPLKELVRAGEFQHIYDPGAGEPEAWYINDHCIIRGHDGLWHMFGITNTEPFSPMEERHLAHATSPELTAAPWRKEPFPVSAREEHGEVHLWAPCVVHHEGLYYMYVCVGDRDHSAYKFHLLTSRDLRKWQRHPANPVVVDGFDARDPHIIRLDDGTWVMYYTATIRPDGGNHIVAALTSRDLINWSGRRVVFKDVEEGTFGGSTESPYVVKRGSHYYLFICNNDRRRGYEATDVYRSQDPFHWEFADWAGVINAHAPEIIEDLDGRWYTTHCGWDRGGLYLAPLTWHDGEEALVADSPDSAVEDAR